MNSNAFRRLASAALLGSAALLPLSAAQAADCPTGGGDALSLGTATRVEAGAERTYTLELRQGDGVIIDLTSFDDPGSSDAAAGAAAAAAAIAIEAAADAAAPAGGSEDEPAPRLRLCNAQGNAVAPRTWDVFGDGGALGVGPDGGERLRFVASDAGRYIVAVPAGETPRELLARIRNIETSGAEPNPTTLGSEIRGKVGKGAMPIYSFEATAGQWVELKAVSESDTVLTLSGPDREGTYGIVAQNDDTDGLNPVIRRRLPVTGTYYLRIHSLGDDSDTFTMNLNRSTPPPPPPAPRPLAVGRTLRERLANDDSNDIYAMQVQAGRTYTLVADAPDYDIYLAIGMANPIEPEEGAINNQAAGFTEIRAQDIGLEGKERLTFTARTSGTIQVLIRSFGLNGSDGGYTLSAEIDGN